MSLDSFLESKITQGELDSKGQFSLDLRRASELLKSLAHNDSYFCFLKLVQVAHRLGSQRVDFRVSFKEITAHFETEELFELDDLVSLMKAAEKPDLSVRPVVADLRAALLGGSQLGSAVSWTTVSKGQARHLKILHSGKVSSGMGPPEAGRPTAPHQRACFFTVKTKSSWQLWKTGSRARRLKDLLTLRCSFSQADLLINKKKIDRADASVLNSHLREFLGTQFNAAIGAMQTLKSRVAPSNILFELSEVGVAVEKPEQKTYTKKGAHLLWTQGLRKQNSYRPDSDDSPAWMLQYLGESDNEKKLVCRSVIAFNIHGPGNQEPLRIKVVRQGVTLMESQLKGEQFDKFRGCTILFADDELPTDLSGLSLVEGEELISRVLEFESLVESGQQYFLGAADDINWA